MKAEQLQVLPIEQIETDSQIRRKLDEGVIRGIMMTIATVGVITPIRVRKEVKRFVVVDGEHRLRAVQLAGGKTVPCIIEEGALTKADILARQLIANCQRADLNPIDKARGIKDLMEATGMNGSAAATHLGLSNSAVTEHVKLLSLSPEIQEKIASGEIATSAGSLLAGIEDPEQRAEYAHQLASGTLTRDGLAGAIKARKRNVIEKPAAEVRRATAILGEGRAVTVVAKGLDMTLLIECLSGLLSEARRSRARGVELSTFLRILKDQSRTV
jgi:ParB family transcriptional regulator, chromosome partitioning protein